MKKFKELILAASVGISIGYILTIIFSLIIAGNSYQALSPYTRIVFKNPNYSLLVQVLIFAILGVGIKLLNDFYQKSELNFLKVSLIHVLGMYLLVTLSGYVLGYFNFTLGSYLGFSLSFMITYLIIWIAYYLYYAKQIKKFNDKLKS